jgi:hypothetical protein
VRKTFFWFVVAGIFNGLLLWAREHLKKEEEGQR